MGLRWFARTSVAMDSSALRRALKRSGPVRAADISEEMPSSDARMAWTISRGRVSSVGVDGVELWIEFILRSKVARQSSLAVVCRWRQVESGKNSG